MNERIDELMIEAGARFEFLHGVHYDDFQYKKFAELIVRDCMGQVWYTREDGINGNVSEVIKDRIKEHFGVEE